MPDAEEFDRLLDAASVRLELLGFAELAEAVHDVASYGSPQVEIPVIERLRTVSAATGWELHEESHVDPDWGIKRTEVTLTHGKNTIDLRISGPGMHIHNATWRIGDSAYQYHQKLAPQRKYRRTETVLEWMRRVAVDPDAERQMFQ